MRFDVEDRADQGRRFDSRNDRGVERDGVGMRDVGMRDVGMRARRRAAMRARRRRNRMVLVSLLAVVLVLVGVDLARGSDGLLRAGTPADSAPSASSASSASSAGEPSSAASSGGAAPTTPTAPEEHATVGAFPASGPGTFSYVAGTGKVVGRAGTLRRYRVAVERGSGQDANAFAGAVDKILADPQGWTATGTDRFQRVPEKGQYDFTVYLATAGTSQKMCDAGGLHTDGFNSCRLPGQVILNLARWLTAVPNYGAGLAEYRAYALNHEVGHQLGLGHEACPGPGQPAPVMQQQTLSLQGCTAWGWPFRHGSRYRGNPVP
jgi:hypothetical protein